MPEKLPVNDARNKQLTNFCLHLNHNNLPFLTCLCFKTKCNILNDSKTHLIYETLFKLHHLEQASIKRSNGGWFMSFTFSPLKGKKDLQGFIWVLSLNAEIKWLKYFILNEWKLKPFQHNVGCKSFQYIQHLQLLMTNYLLIKHKWYCTLANGCTRIPEHFFLLNGNYCKA